MFRGGSRRLFRVLGFEVSAHWSLFVALGLAAYLSGGLVGAAFSAALFVCILAHELGHAVVARRRGVPIDGIDLHFFGGVAKMAAPPRSPNDEIAIAVAGPVVSLVLGVVLLVVGGAPIVTWLGGANLILAAFNALPALPLDGGRVLRALLARRRGLVEGTRTAVLVSRVIAIGLAVVGAFTMPTLVLLAVLVWLLASQEQRGVMAHHALTFWGYTSPWARYDAASRRGRAVAPDAVY